jgi:hypothetical protein
MYFDDYYNLDIDAPYFWPSGLMDTYRNKKMIEYWGEYKIGMDCLPDNLFEI